MKNEKSACQDYHVYSGKYTTLTKLVPLVTSSDANIEMFRTVHIRLTCGELGIRGTSIHTQGLDERIAVPFV